MGQGFTDDRLFSVFLGFLPVTHHIFFAALNVCAGGGEVALMVRNERRCDMF